MNAPSSTSVPSYEPISSLISRLDRALPDGEDVSVGQFLPLLGVHGFIFIILVLALLNIAIFMLPGLSILFGLPMIIMAVQLLIGLRTPVFPVLVRRQKVRLPVLHRGLNWAAEKMKVIERAVRPRWLPLTHPVLFKAHCVVLLILALMVAIPVPFVNIPPTIGVILLSIGLMQRDGLFILSSYMFCLWSLWLYESLGRAAQWLV